MSKRQRAQQLTRLYFELSGASERSQAMALLYARSGWEESGLSLIEYASAVCGAVLRAPDGCMCSHLTHEFAANAMKCPDFDERGGCRECPF